MICYKRKYTFVKQDLHKTLGTEERTKDNLPESQLPTYFISPASNCDNPQMKGVLCCISAQR